jgi:hypothetical protein
MRACISYSMEKHAPVSLVDLPDPCLLAVLRCLADGPISLFSAARAHSRLHQTAVVALSSIIVDVKKQEQMDGVLLYLEQHGKHVGSVHLQVLRCELHHTLTLCKMPPNLQLHSLQCDNLRLQLQPSSDGFQGVLKPGLPLKQLRLHNCMLLDGAEVLAAAWQVLSLLTGLEDLSISCWVDMEEIYFPTAVIAPLQHLTCLELCVGGSLQGAHEAIPALQPLQELTRLAALKVDCWGSHSVTASILSQLCQLTRLELVDSYSSTSDVLAPAALAGKTQLQHLAVSLSGSAGRAAALLSELRQLTQLTYLGLKNSFHGIGEGNPPALAFSVLTASSKLQYLNVSDCTLPAGVWQHVFPAGRQLPHLHTLLVSSVVNPLGGFAASPAGSRLVSCCPGLQSLDMWLQQYSGEGLATLSGLCSLSTLLVSSTTPGSEGLEVVGQLTGLRHLRLHAYSSQKELLLQVTQLKQLTNLQYAGVLSREYKILQLEHKVGAQSSLQPWFTNTAQICAVSAHQLFCWVRAMQVLYSSRHAQACETWHAHVP